MPISSRPARESSCECERSDDLQLGPIMALVSGPTVAEAIGDPKNAIASLSKESEGNAELIESLFLRILNRPATPREVDTCLEVFDEIGADHEQLAAHVLARPAREEHHRAGKVPRLAPPTRGDAV